MSDKSHCPICKKIYYECKCSNELWDKYYRMGELDDYLFGNSVNSVIVDTFDYSLNVAPLTMQQYFDQFKDE